MVGRILPAFAMLHHFLRVGSLHRLKKLGGAIEEKAG